MSHFKLISSTKASDVIPINKYVSGKTGLTVVIADVEGPVVNGFFCLATEAHDDDGLPHTLEHLIFLGSERYPYKGILDLLANRCMAQGTNAWTDTDHTCYTIYTGGDEGMLTLLPIYLDHILRPTLSDEGYLTEVHHIDGEGNDAGVVYCEMQGRENSADSRCELQLLRSMYPCSGYSAETGGVLRNLRISTDNVKVRDYHKKFYRPENLTIILTGQIAADDVFKALATVEDDIIAKREKEPQEEWVKPWQTLPPPPLLGEHTVFWPADTEDCGMVMFGWRGPVLTSPTAHKQMTACAVLLRYLAETAAAPLQQCLVEREDAMAGDVSYNLTENLVTLIKVELNNVPVQKLRAAYEEARQCIAAVRTGQNPIDMDRIGRLLKKQLREMLASLESDPHHAIAFRCIGDLLYSRDENDFIQRMNPQIAVNELLKENVDYWLSIMQQYFTDDMVVILGAPNIELQESMAFIENKRLTEQKKELGEAGLAEKARQLQAAIEHNERPPPAGTLAAVPVPTCARVRAHRVSCWSSGAEPCPLLDLTQLPLYTRLQSLKTNFVYINFLLDTSGLDSQTRQWVPLYTNSLGQLAVRRGAQLVPHEAVISDTERITVHFSNEIGFGKSGNFSVGSYGQFLHVEVTCEPADYEQVVNHLYEILYCSELSKERLLVFVQRMINDVSQVRRNGHKMVYDVLRDAVYNENTNTHWCSVLRQQKFLKNLLEQLTAGGDSAEAALREGKDAFQKILEKPWLHLSSDLTRYKLSTEPWKKFTTNDVAPVEPKLYYDAELMHDKSVPGFVVGIGGLESSFSAQFSPGPRGYDLADVAPLTLLLQYFTQLEGPMWRQIRGSGLSYGYSVRVSQSEGRLLAALYRAASTVPAYDKLISILQSFLKDGEFDEDLFQSAKSTAIFDVLDSEKCPADVVSQSLLNYVRRCPQTYSRDLICALSQATMEDARAAAQRWLPPLSQPARGTLAVVCHPSKVTEIQQAFLQMNIKLDAFESMEASHFNQ
ncbi:uncharacterized protein C05D11.1-like [Plodia interpunctella]|uniref:uncharacterized protein C05D11.1-like n=1 Tax=Plodia interpunctella TaxID=58824 RepID=UPI002367B94B|nr:uncharacterized protein C05D11.1-like [Plodia interpunctella]